LPIRRRTGKKTPNPFDAWVRVTPDNRVTLILGKSEMGQGIMTALPMILAEELCVDWKQVKVQQAPTNPKIYDSALAAAAAWRVRGCLCVALARRSRNARRRGGPEVEVGPDTCKAENGQVVHAIPSAICLR